jgi:hypothetical protein
MSSAAEGAQGDASRAPRATRSQLDHMFEILREEKDINTDGNCELCELPALEMETECGYIGYCYYMVNRGRWSVKGCKKAQTGCNNHQSTLLWIFKHLRACCRKKMPGAWQTMAT